MDTNTEQEFMSLEDGFKLLEDEEKAGEDLGKTPEETAKPNDEEARKPAVPDKFKDKTREEIADSYTRLEEMLGKQANEIGDLRRELRERSPNTEQNAKRLEEELSGSSVEFGDIVEDPKNAVGKLIKEEMKDYVSDLDTLKREKNEALFKGKYPNYGKDLSDPDFQQWVVKSKHRQNLLSKANEYDYESADELWGDWYERKELLGEVGEREAQQQQATLDKQIKDATTETGSTGDSSTKIIPRQEIINLRLTNPAKYEAMQERIAELYKKGLIK